MIPDACVDRTSGGWLAFCPGCRCGHVFDDKWTFDGNVVNPTFAPSMLVDEDMPKRRCHSHLRAGKWHFGKDCFHALAGQVVDAIPLSTLYGEEKS